MLQLDKPRSASMDAFLRATVRDRRAPTPALKGGIGGYFQVQRVNRAGQVTGEWEFHNLFLDAGLDRIATNYFGNNSWFSHCAVGTGSNDPAVHDTALGNEIARVNTHLPGSNVTEHNIASGYTRFSKTFEFGFDVGNGNLTEVLIAGTSSGAPISRELFRDAQDNPVTITKTNQDLLRVTYTVQLDFQEFDTWKPGTIMIQGLGVISGQYGFVAGGNVAPTVGQGRHNAAMSVAAAHRSGTASAVGDAYLSRDAPNSPLDTSMMSNNRVAQATDRSWSAFTPGIWKRSISATWDTTRQLEVTSFGITGYRGNGIGYGFTFVIDEADRFFKDNEHILTLNNFYTVQWGRAGEI